VLVALAGKLLQPTKAAAAAASQGMVRALRAEAGLPLSTGLWAELALALRIAAQRLLAASVAAAAGVMIWLAAVVATQVEVLKCPAPTPWSPLVGVVRTQ